MNYVVFDLEWNQALGPSLQVKEPILLHGDIIEIGAVKLDEHFNQIDTFCAYIRPEFYLKMHRKVGNLTHIAPQKLLEAPYFTQVYQSFAEWCGDDFRFISWGKNDLPMLLENLLVRGMNPEDLPDVIDAQEIFGYRIMNEPVCCALSKAVRLLNLPLETAHDALNDAINTVRVMNCMDMEECIRWYDYVDEDYVVNSETCFA